MEVEYKDKKYQITCDSNMSNFVADNDGYCCQKIPMCKLCILKHLGEQVKEGWDEKENYELDMYFIICGDHVKL